MTTEEKGSRDALMYSQEERRRLQDKLEDVQKENRALKSQLEATQAALQNIKAYSEDGLLDGLDYADFLHAKAQVRQATTLLNESYRMLDTIRDETDHVGALKAWYPPPTRGGFYVIDAVDALRKRISAFLHTPPYEDDSHCPQHQDMKFTDCLERYEEDKDQP